MSLRGTAYLGNAIWRDLEDAQNDFGKSLGPPNGNSSVPAEPSEDLFFGRI